MSDLLKEAVIDAEALKKVARKQAEEEVIEKYTNEVKNVMEAILFVDEDKFTDLEDEENSDGIGGPIEPGGMTGGDESGFVDDLEDDPFGDDGSGEEDFGNIENVGHAFRGDGEEVIIDFAKLKEMIDDEEENLGIGQELDRNETAEEMGDEMNSDLLEDFDIDESSLDSFLDEVGAGVDDLRWSGNSNRFDEEDDEEEDLSPLEKYKRERRQRDEDPEHYGYDPAEDETFELNEDELFEELMSEINEEMEVDVDGTKTGWKMTSTSRVNDEDEEHAARAENPPLEDQFEDDPQLVRHNMINDVDENQYLYEEFDVLYNEMKYKLNFLENERATFKNKLNSKESQKQKLFNENKILKNNIQELNNMLGRTNLERAKLFYENRVLRNSSLNERQKKVFVDKISKTQNINEAKTVFNTLDETVMTTIKGQNNTREDALTEAINKSKKYHLVATAQRQTEEEDDSMFDKERLQFLAGIKKQ